MQARFWCAPWHYRLNLEKRPSYTALRECPCPCTSTYALFTDDRATTFESLISSHDDSTAQDVVSLALRELGATDLIRAYYILESLTIK